MSLRELLTERILFAVSPDELEQHYHVTEDELNQLSDLDLFELYETVYLDDGR